MRTGALLALLPALLLFAAGAHAQTVRLYVATDSVLVGERFAVAVAVERGPATETVLPEPPLGAARIEAPLRAGQAELLALRRFPPTRRGEALVDSAVYEAAVFALDSARVGPVEVRLVSGGDTLVVRSNARFVGVRSVLDGADDTLAPYEPIQPFPRPAWPWLAAALALLLAALAAWWWKRHRRPAPGAARPDLPAAEEARRRLAELETAPPASAEAVPAYYVTLSDVLRTYLARRLGVPARERTTRELLDALRGHEPALPAEAHAALGRALGQADLVKFAGVVPSASDRAAAVADARRVVETLEATLTPPDSP